MSKSNGHGQESLYRAFSHPLRVQVLRSIAAGEQRSPKALCERFELPVENVAYHVRTLRKDGYIRLTSAKPGVRGSIQHFYDATDKGRNALLLLGLAAEPFLSDAEIKSLLKAVGQSKSAAVAVAAQKLQEILTSR